MIHAFQSWIQNNQALLNERRINTHLSEPTQGLSKNSIFADFKSDRYEATVQVWESGESDFHTDEPPLVSASEATVRYEITPPTHRIVFPMKNVRDPYIPEEGPLTSGGGRQFVTDHPIPMQNARVRRLRE